MGKTSIYRLFNISGNCLNCNWELGEVSYLVDPPVEPYEFAVQNGALCAECALEIATNGDQFTTEEEAVVTLRTL